MTLFNTLITEQDNTLYLEDNYASHYFFNLKNNFGNNTHGTCAFVSLGMLLSYYDTYWDDNFVPNVYEQNATFNSNKINNSFYLIPLSTPSPGIKFEPMNSVSALLESEYFEWVANNSGVYFQAKLIDLAKNYFTYLYFDSMDEEYLSLNISQLQSFLQYYLYDYNDFTTSEVSVEVKNRYMANLKAHTIENIKDGVPTLLYVKNTTTTAAHAVIAYDYNFLTGDIYVHSGWRDSVNNKALTHVTLDDLTYSEILYAVTLRLNLPMNLAAKDAFYNASHLIYPNNIELTSGNYVTSRPTFEWNSLFKEEWFIQYNTYIVFEILDNNKNVLSSRTIDQNKWTLTSDEWHNARLSNSSSIYYIRLSLTATVSGPTFPYWCEKQFTKPNDYAISIVHPDEYGFADAYPVTDDIKENYIEHNVNGFTFETRRYRTGYIHNEYIVMSPIRNGIDYAFIEFRFPRAITRMDVELSHWRELTSELLDDTNGNAVLQQYIGRTWIPIFDLLSPETALPRDRNNPTTYEIEFNQPAYRIRFYSDYNGEHTGDNNKGRICIGDIKFYVSNYNMPLSCYELDYFPWEWNTGLLPSWTNCYSYALNAKRNPNEKYENLLFIPGQSLDRQINVLDIPNIELLVNLIRADSIEYQFYFEEINKNEICPPGTYKIALVVDDVNFAGSNINPDYDFHFYRQNSDGTWSHKPGTTDVTNLDYSSELILDPETCNRKYSDELNYTNFVGFYCVSPIMEA